MEIPVRQITYLNPEQKKNASRAPVGQATDKKLRSLPTKSESFKSGHQRVWRPTRQHAIKEGSIVINHDCVKN